MATKTAKKPAKKHAGKKVAKQPAKKLAPKRTSIAHAAKPGTAVRESAVACLRMSHEMVRDYTAPFTSTNATTQPAGNANHILWSLGHLAHSYHWFASMVDGKGMSPAPKGYEELFGMNTKPTDDPAKYPSLAEVRQAFDAGLKRIEQAAKKLDDATCLATPAGNSDGWLTSKLDAIQKCAWHNGWHLGQITNIRRALGITAKK